LPPPPWVIAHRGASGERLENTVAAVLLAVAQGAPMCEVDVQLTADGELVVFHDWDLRRLRAGDPGVVEALPAGELVGRDLELVEPAAAPRRGRLPALAELLAELPASYPLNLELKRRHADRGRLADAVVRLAGEREQVLVSSFDHQLLAEVARRRGDLPLMPLESREPGRLMAAAVRLAAWGVGCHGRIATAALAAEARAARRPWLVYTVNHAEQAWQLFAAGASGVFSDWPGKLATELDAERLRHEAGSGGERGRG
jgi:glycerophosphoryl diester phosphodiesterase